MSLLYRDNQGNETHIAGLNGVSGELVPSVSLVREGIKSISAIPAHSQIDTEVTFSSPMPDTDYDVIFEDVAQNQGYTIYSVHTKSASGFTMTAFNADVGEAVATSIKYKAFKLMTDETTQLDEAQIALNKQDITTIKGKIPANASSSNQLVTAADNNFKYTNLGDVVVDVDTLIVPGVYSVRNKSPSTQHLPSSVAQDAWCVIYVTEVDNNPTFVQQKCIDWSGNEWNRYSQSGTWFSWVGIQKEDTAVKWIGSAGSMTLAQIYAAYSQQNTRIYKGFFDWQDARVPLYGQGADTVEITCYDWNLTATTIRGKSFWYNSSTDAWIENTPIVTTTAQIQTDVNGNIGLYAILPASANVEVISVRGTDIDSDFTYIPGRNYQGDWWCQLFTWAGVKLTGVHTYNIEIKYRRLP